MKTIIMRDPVMESEGSRFPRVNLNYNEAKKEVDKLSGRLPTSSEYDRLFAIDPWPHIVCEWTSTTEGNRQVIRGGWYGLARFARSASRLVHRPGDRLGYVGFRLARDVPDDAPVPEGWIVI